MIDLSCPIEGDELALEAAAGEIALAGGPAVFDLTSSPRSFQNASGKTKKRLLRKSTGAAPMNAKRRQARKEAEEMGDALGFAPRLTLVDAHNAWADAHRAAADARAAAYEAQRTNADDTTQLIAASEVADKVEHDAEVALNETKRRLEEDAADAAEENQ